MAVGRLPTDDPEHAHRPAAKGGIEVDRSSRDPALAEVLDLLPERLAIVDRDGTIEWANDAWEAEAHRLVGVFGRGGVGDRLRDDEAPGLERNDRAGSVRAGIRSVLDRLATHFELELNPPIASTPGRISATALSAGRVLVAVKQGGPLRRRVGAATDGSPEPAQAPAERIASPPGERITRRELDVLRGLLRGLDNRAIAAELGVSYASVRAYVRSLIAKYGVRSRLELVAHVYRGGIDGR